MDTILAHSCHHAGLFVWLCGYPLRLATVLSLKHRDNLSLQRGELLLASPDSAWVKDGSRSCIWNPGAYSQILAPLLGSHVWFTKPDRKEWPTHSLTHPTINDILKSNYSHIYHHRSTWPVFELHISGITQCVCTLWGYGFCSTSCL